MPASNHHVSLKRYPLSERLKNVFWETWFGISTRGVVDVDHPDSYHYATMSYSSIQRILRFLSLQASDVLIDIGSGKGRFLCCAALYPVKKVVGVDLSKEFCEQARLNAERLRGRRAPVVVHNMEAQKFDYREGTAFTLFNPFGASSLDAVLSKMKADRNSSPVRIAYANPLHEDIFAKHSWLERYEYWDRDKLGIEHSVSFYRSR